MNVLDLRGPEFLLLYLALFAAAFVAAFLLRRWLRRPAGGADQLARGRFPELHPLEVAYLGGGPRASTDAAISMLVHRGSLAVDKGGKQARLTASSLPPADVTMLETAVYAAVRSNDGRVAPVRRAAIAAARAIEGRLRSLGLLLDGPQRVQVRLVPAACLLMVVALGLSKILIGVERDKPVGFLVALCVVTLGTAMTFVVLPAFRSRLGNYVLAGMRRHHAALRTTARRAPASLAGADLSMAVALYGTAAFASGDMRDVNRALGTPQAGGSGCGGGSSCGSGSCGGGGGGGCGGGGCGGCGGGG